MGEEPQWAITLYVPDGLLPALKGEGAAIRGVLEGAPELGFIVPRWWERARTVRLGALNPVTEPQSHAVDSDGPS